MLGSQIYGRAIDLCKGVPVSIIQSDNGSDNILRHYTNVMC